MEKLIFCSMADDTEAVKKVAAWVRSIRDFGGELARAPVWVMVPDEQVGGALALPGVQVHTFAPGDGAPQFPFTMTVAAAAKAEVLADGATELLAWMAPETLVLQEPRPFLLPPDKGAGARPVDVCLIGPRWEEALDSYWETVYSVCEATPDRFFPVTASADQALLKPHFNAGLVVVRPERGVLRTWWQNHLRLHNHPAVTPWSAKGEYYQVLVHQAALSGSILGRLGPGEVQVFPHQVSYPLHLHDQYPAALRPEWMEDLITCRYYLEYDPRCLEWLPAREPLARWLKTYL